MKHMARMFEAAAIVRTVEPAVRRSAHFPLSDVRAFLAATPSSRFAPQVGSRIATGGCHRQPSEVVGPTLLVAGAGLGVGQSTVGHAQQRPAPLVDQVDLDQADPGGIVSRPSQPKL